MIKKSIYLFLAFSLHSIVVLGQFDLNPVVRNSCNGVGSGAITVTVTNNTAASSFTYYWLGPDNFNDTLAVTNVGGAPLTSTRGALFAGQYRVYVYRDVDLAVQAVTVDVLQSAAPLSLVFGSSTPATCDPGGDGSLTVTASGGEPPYLFSIRNHTGAAPLASDFTVFAGNGGFFNALAVGQYDVAVRDAYNCVSIISNVAVAQQVSVINLTLVDTDNPICPGGTDGRIEVAASNGTPPYRYAIQPNGGALTEASFITNGGFFANGGIFLNVGEGIYDLAVKDDDGCVAFITGIGIVEPDPIQITSEVRFTTCDDEGIPNNNNGSINILTVAGGTGPYTYAWTDPDGVDMGLPPGTLSLTNLVEGIYSVVVTDANGCEAFFPFRIYEGFEIVSIPENISCAEADDGRITLNIIWDNLRFTGDPAVMLPHGQPGVNQFVTWTGKDPDGNDLTITDVDNDNVLENLGPGTYIATVTDQFGCVKRDTIDIIQPFGTLLIDSVRVTDVICRGAATGRIEIFASGGTGFYQYSIDNGGAFQGQRLFTNLLAGTFDIVVQDGNGCTAAQPVTILEPPTGYSIATVNTVNINCYDNPETGQATVVLAKSDPSHPITRITWFTAGNVQLKETVNPVVEDFLFDLAEGGYIVEVEDDYGCIRRQPFNINRPEEFKFTSSQQNVPCPEGGPVSMSVIVEGGTPPYNYQWDKGGATFYPDNTPTLSLPNVPGNQGVYNLRVTDSAPNGACEILTSFNITIPNPISLTVNLPVKQNACIGGTEGAIGLTITGGTPLPGNNYKVTWTKDGNPYSNDQNINNLGAGTYEVSVTDALDCQAVTDIVIITEPTTTFDIVLDNIKNVTCSGGNDGAINITMNIEAGHPKNQNDFKYRWYRNNVLYAEDIIDIAGLTAGTYRLEVNDNYFGPGDGCTKMQTFVVQDFTPIVLNPTVVQIQCPGDTDGSISLAPLGGNTSISGDYNYVWRRNLTIMGTETGSSISNLEPNSYTVEVTDDEGCVATQTFVINAIPVFNIVEDEQQISCLGANDGAISLTVTGGTPPYTYNWSRNTVFLASTASINNLDPANYEVTVTDSRGCLAFNKTYTINVPTTFTLANGGVTNVRCNGESNGAINTTITIDPGHPTNINDFIYSWTRNGAPYPAGAGLKDLTNVPAGNYVLTVNDGQLGGGCEKTIAFTVLEYPPINIIPNVTQMSCPGADDGSISINVGGGFTGNTGVYTIEWRKNNVPIPGETGPSISGLSPDTYQIRVTDDQNCTRQVAVTINNIAPFIVTANVQQITCDGDNNGSIDLTISGGTPGYTYNWSRNGNFFANTQDISNLDPAVYEVYVTDQNNCVVHDQDYVINDPTTFTIAGVANGVVCNGESNGSINVTVTTEAGHPRSANDFDYTWTFNGNPFPAGTGQRNLTGLAPGTYIITVNDQGCIKTETFTVGQPPVLNINLAVTQPTCPGDFGSAVIDPIGGDPDVNGDYTIQWLKSNTVIPLANGKTLNNLEADTYRVRITDERGCVRFQNFVINNIPAATYNVDVAQISCAGETDGRIEVTNLTGGTGALDIVWRRNGTLYATNTLLLEDLNPATYQLVVTDANDCELVRQDYVIAVPTDFYVTSTVTDISCNGLTDGSINVVVTIDAGHPTAPGNFTYTWTKDGNPFAGATPIISNLGVGNYELTINDNKPGGGCIKTFQYQIIEYTPIVLNLTSQALVCPGISDGRITISPVGGNTSISGDYDIKWYRGGVLQPFNGRDYTGLNAGLYRVEVTDDQGCMVTANVEIEEVAPFDITAQNIQQISCTGANDGAIEISFQGGNGPFTIQWLRDGVLLANTTNSISNLIPGDYQVTVTDVNNCQVVQETYEIRNPTTTFTIAGAVTDVRCFGESNGSIDITITPDPGHPLANTYTYTWLRNGMPFLQGQVDIFNLLPGTYELFVNDNSLGATGCEKSASFEVRQFNQIQVNPNPTQILCPGDNTGRIEVIPIGGNISITNDYTYAWYRGATLLPETTSVLSNLTADTYRVIVTDDQGCSREEIINIAEIQPFAINDVVNDVSCIGGSDGSISLSFSGGTPPYTVIWERNGSFFSNQANITNLAPGNYDVTVTDVNNCSAVQDTYTINEPTTSFTITGVVQNIRCNGETNGSIDITITNDAGHPRNPATYLYSWTRNGVNINQNFPDISNLGVGLYEITVNDAGCIKTASFQIEQYNAITVNYSVENISCPGESDASITIQPNGGLVTGNYTIEWYKTPNLLPGENGLVLSGIDPGNYQVRVTDDQNCTRIENIAVPNLAPISSVETVTQISCVGLTDGAISANISGGTAPYTITWLYNGAFFSNQSLIHGLAPGSYDLSITDANNCQSIDKNIVIAEPTTFYINLVSKKDITCPGDSDGRISVNITTDAGHPRNPSTFTYTWTKDGAFFANVLTTIQGLDVGTYELTVNDNGCTKSAAFTIVQYPPITINPVVTQMTCAGANDGSITIEPNGGNVAGAYTIAWFRNNVPLTTNVLTISNLTPGAYRVNVTDDQGCTVTATRNIEPKTPMTLATPVVTRISCPGDDDATITLAVSGGTAPYSFEWTYNGLFVSNNQNLTNLQAGDYTVRIIDGNNCTTIEQTINVPASTGFDISGNITHAECSSSTDGEIDVTITVDAGHPTNANQFTYTWFRNNVQVDSLFGKRKIINLSPADYRLVVNDNTPGGGCEKEQTFVVIAFSEVLINPIVRNISCPGANDGRIEINPVGGAAANPYIIRWFKNVNLMSGETGLFIANLEPDYYRVEVEDNEGCVKLFETTLADKPGIVVDSTIYQLKCKGDQDGAIKVNISGGEPPYRIFWRRGNEIIAQNTDTIGALPQGRYQLIVEDQSNCPRFERFYQIDTLNTEYTGGIRINSRIVCHNDSNGELQAVILPQAGHPTKGYTRRWFKDNGTTPFSTDSIVSSLGVGTYRVVVTDTLGCTKEATVSLTNPTPIDIRANVQQLVCNDATTAVIQLDPRGGWGGYSVVWSEATRGVLNNTTLRLANIGAGEYTISLTDSVGCRKDTVILIQNPARMVVSRSITNVNCKGGNNGAINITVTNGTSPYTFEWRRDTALFSTTQNVDGLTAGTYRVRVRDNNGCILVSDPFIVTEPNVEWTVDADLKPITCHLDTDAALTPKVELTGGNATFTFNWYKDSVLYAQSTRNIAALDPGKYRLQVIDNFGCEKNSEYDVIDPMPLVMNQGVFNVTCFGARDGRISIQVTGGYGDYKYKWRRFNSAMPDTIPTVENLDVGIYQVDVTDAQGCTISRRFEITQALPLIVRHEVKHNTCPTNFDSEIKVTVTGGIEPYRFLWADGNGVPISTQKDVFNLPPDNYTLIVIDSFFCEVTTQPIRVTAPPALGFNFLEFKDNLCPQTSNGVISVQGKGGTGPYTFSFDSSVFSLKNDFFGLAKGTYALAMMDSRGCLFDTTVFVDNQYELEADFIYEFQDLAIDYPITFKDQSIGQNIVKWFWNFGDQRAANTPESTINYEAVGQYVVELTVENEVQCVSTKRDTLNIEKGYVFTIPGGFSPNTDGLNDFFRPIFDNVTDITTRILDRNGQLVFSSDERSQFWDGTVDGKKAPQGPYYYEISYISRAGKRRFEKGKVMLIR